MGDRDFVKPLLESRGTVHFGKVCLHVLRAQAAALVLPLRTPPAYHPRHRGHPGVWWLSTL